MPIDIFIAHFRQLPKNQNPNNPFITRSGDWRIFRVANFFAQIIKTIRLAYVTVYIWGGQFARGPELGTITVRKGQNSTRNIYWVLHRVLIYQPYNKNVFITENGPGISRFFFAQFNLALLRFLVYIRPAFFYLCKQCHIFYTSNDYLFRPYSPPKSSVIKKYWEIAKLTKTLRSVSAPFGFDFTIARYRQATIAIA